MCRTLKNSKSMKSNNRTHSVSSHRSCNDTEFMVAHTDTNIVDLQGNTQVQAGSFTKTDGTTASIGGFNLQRDTVYNIAYEWLNMPNDIAVLPDLQGYGNVYDLHRAIVRDTTGTIKSLINQFITEEDPGIRDDLMEQILFKWIGSNVIDPACSGTNFDTRKFAVIEKLMGQQFLDEKVEVYFRRNQ